MSAKSVPTIEQLVAQEHMALDYTNELPPKVGAVLDDSPTPAFIAVNATHPVYEQHFSIGHALGGYAFARRPPPVPWYQPLLNRKYRSRFMKVWARGVRLTMHKRLGPKTRNNVFAIIMMMSLGDRDNLRQFLEKHPEMVCWAVYFAILLRLRALKLRLSAIVKRLFSLNTVLP